MRMRSLPELWPCWTRSLKRRRQLKTTTQRHIHLLIFTSVIKYDFVHVSSSRLVKALRKNQPLPHYLKRSVQILLRAAWAVRQRAAEEAACRRMPLVPPLRRTPPPSEPAPNWPRWRKSKKREMYRQRAKQLFRHQKSKSPPKRSRSLLRATRRSSLPKQEPRLKRLPRNQRWARYMFTC